MRQPILGGLLACLAASPLLAQEAPKGDLFGGYSMRRVDDASGSSESWHGWQASLAKNFGGHLGLVADFSGHSKEGNDDFTYMGGLRYAFHGSRTTLFLQGLAGGYKNTSGIEVLNVKISESESGLAWAAGGGLSLRVASHLDVRVQADYLSFKLDDGSNGNLRFAAGLAYVFR